MSQYSTWLFENNYLRMSPNAAQYLELLREIVHSQKLAAEWKTTETVS